MLIVQAEGNSIATVAVTRIEDKPDEADANAVIDCLDNADDDHADDFHVDDDDYSDVFNDDADSLELQSLQVTPRSTHPHHRKEVILPQEYLVHQLSPLPFCTHSNTSLSWGHHDHPRNPHHHLSQMP